MTQGGSSLLCFRLTSCNVSQPMLLSDQPKCAELVSDCLHHVWIFVFYQFLPDNADIFLPNKYKLLSLIRCRYLTSSQSREGRKTQRSASSHFFQVIACTTSLAIQTGSIINNVQSGTRAASTRVGDSACSSDIADEAICVIFGSQLYPRVHGIYTLSLSLLTGIIAQ